MKKINKSVFSKASVLGLILGFSAGAVVVNAAISNIFSSGTPIVAADVNTNFSELDARLAILEVKALVGQTGRMAYFWSGVLEPVDNDESNQFYSYNSTGGVNTVSQTGPGNYTVTLPGMEPEGGYGGDVQVTAYEFDATYHHCMSGGWVTVPDTTNVEVYVACFDADGTPLNSLFSIRYIR